MPEEEKNHLANRPTREQFLAMPRLHQIRHFEVINPETGQPFTKEEAKAHRADRIARRIANAKLTARKPKVLNARGATTESRGSSKYPTKA